MNLFSYDSPPMQILMFIGDLIILNILFLICCLPIFTIGAAQAGLYTAIRVLLDKEDDSSAAGAFFRGFATGFGTVTAAWGIMTLLLAGICVAGYFAIAMGAPIWIIAIAVCLCVLFQSLISAFHSRFNCTAMQLIRNTWFLVVAHPLRSIGVAILIWLPAGIFLFDTYSFMAATSIWGSLYFSTAILFCHTFLKKPFAVLVDNFNASHGIVPEAEAEPEAIADGSEDPYETGEFFTMPPEEPAQLPGDTTSEQ